MEIIAAIVMLLIFGALFALPLLIPPLRRRARSNHAFRISVVSTCSLLAWILITVSLSYTGGSLSTIFATIGCGDGEFYQGEGFVDSGLPCISVVDPQLMDAFEHEVGMRSVMPPPLQNLCFTGIAEVCTAADDWMSMHSITWGEYLIGWLLLSITGMSTAVVGWYLTRSIEKQKRKIAS